MKSKVIFGAVVGLLAVLAVPGAAFAQSYGGWGYDPYTTQGLYSYYSPLSQYGYSGYGYGSYDPYQYSYSPYGYSNGYSAYGSYGYNPYDYNSYNWYQPYLNQGCNYQFYGYQQNCQNQNAAAPSITNVSGPNALLVGQQGTWTITTSAGAGNLSASVQWGDAQYGSAAAAQSVSQGNTFSHAYQYPGTYTITFTVTDGYGRSNSASATVVVSANSGCANCSSGVNFSASVNPYSQPLVVAFSASGLQQNSSYFVDFGDGSGTQWLSMNGTSGSVSHTYATTGTYTATLILEMCGNAAYVAGCSNPTQQIVGTTKAVVALPL